MGDNLKIIGIFVGIVALIAVAIAIDAKDTEDWNQYRNAHHCVVTGHLDSSTGWGTDFKGRMVMTTTSGKILFRCDGGEIIGRSE